MTWALGSTVPLEARVTDENKAPLDVTGATFTLTPPDGSAAVVRTGGQVGHPEQGRYTLDWDTTGKVIGRWEWIFTGTVPAVAYGPDTFEVAASIGAPIVGVADARAHLGLTSTTSDLELLGFLNTASDACEAFTRQCWRRATYTAERHYCDDGHAIFLRHSPVASVAEVKVNGAVVDAAGYAVSPAGDMLYRMAGYYRTAWECGIIDVTYTVAPQSIPHTITHGVREMARHLWETQRGPTIARQGPDDEWVPGVAYSIPRRVAELWQPEALVLVQ
jgi:hypothetical protein